MNVLKLLAGLEALANAIDTVEADNDTLLDALDLLAEDTGSEARKVANKIAQEYSGDMELNVVASAMISALQDSDAGGANDGFDTDAEPQSPGTPAPNGNTPMGNFRRGQDVNIRGRLYRGTGSVLSVDDKVHVRAANGKKYAYDNNDILTGILTPA